jgi:hypothetical protein
MKPFLAIALSLVLCAAAEARIFHRHRHCSCGASGGCAATLPIVHVTPVVPVAGGPIVDPTLPPPMPGGGPAFPNAKGYITPLGESSTSAELRTLGKAIQSKGDLPAGWFRIPAAQDSVKVGK